MWYIWCLIALLIVILILIIIFIIYKCVHRHRCNHGYNCRHNHRYNCRCNRGCNRRCNPKYDHEYEHRGGRRSERKRDHKGSDKGSHKKKHKSNPDRNSKISSLNQVIQPFGFAYNEVNDYFYALIDGWQRKYGYCELYDDAMPLASMIVDSEPIAFEYDNRKWLIELWKGQYGMTTGAEVGIYYSKCEEISIAGFYGTFYRSVPDEEMLPISMVLRKDNQIVCQRRGIDWWLTAFKLGEFCEPEELTLDVDITFPNQEMCRAFVKALIDLGYGKDELFISLNKVSITYTKPHNKQPLTRNKLQRAFVQKNNRKNCKRYHKLTKKYDNTLDKIECIEKKAPVLYSVAVNSVHMKDIYKGYNLIEPFIKEDC